MAESTAERVYVGPHAEVEVPVPNGDVVVVKSGQAGTFPADFAKTLDEQGCWSRNAAKTTAGKE